MTKVPHMSFVGRGSFSLGCSYSYVVLDGVWVLVALVWWT